MVYYLEVHKQPYVNTMEPQHPVKHLPMFHFIWSTTFFWSQITIPAL